MPGGSHWCPHCLEMYSSTPGTAQLPVSVRDQTTAVLHRQRRLTLRATSPEHGRYSLSRHSCKPSLQNLSVISPLQPWAAEKHLFKNLPPG